MQEVIWRDFIDACCHELFRTVVLNLFLKGATSTQRNIFGGRNQQFKLKRCTVSPGVFFIDYIIT